MGGRTPHVSNRETDRRNKLWLQTKVKDYPYTWTINNFDLKPEFVKDLFFHDFIRVPFPGKNQVVWGFKTYEDLIQFKKEYMYA